MTKTPNMKQYVGTAKTAPDSRTPRKLSAIKMITAIDAAVASCPSRKCRIGTDFAFWTPEEMDTATVRT